jgi:hypothetical protein
MIRDGFDVASQLGDLETSTAALQSRTDLEPTHWELGCGIEREQVLHRYTEQALCQHTKVKNEASSSLHLDGVHVHLRRDRLNSAMHMRERRQMCQGSAK